MIARLGSIAIDQVEVERDSGFDRYGHGEVRGIADGEKLTVQGWVIGNSSVAVGVELGDPAGGKIADVVIDQPRPDIAAAFEGLVGAATSGFRITLRPQGTASKIQVLVAFDDGVKVELATISCKPEGGNPETGGAGWTVETEDRENEKVMFGEEGWLYLRRDSNDILGQHTGKVRFEREQLEEWGAVLEGRMRESERLGAVWACVIAPDMESVYPEFLPQGIVPVARRPVHEFLEVAADVSAPVLYPLEELSAAKRVFDVYPKTDTHWHYRGAYVAYLAFCEAARTQGLDLGQLGEADIRWVDGRTEGDLGSKVSPDPLVGPTIGCVLNEQRGHLTSDNGVANHGRVLCFEQDLPGPRCVVFGESFTPFMLPFLKETFQRLVFVHTSMFASGILEQERPDVILSLPTERFLIRVPDDAKADAELRATALRKGGKLPWPALA
jgi:hypothetical protein